MEDDAISIIYVHQSKLLCILYLCDFNAIFVLAADLYHCLKLT